MNIARREIRLFFAFGLITAAVLAWNAFDNNQQNSQHLSVSTQSDMDFFIIDAVFTSYDLAGNLSQTATAKKVEHFKQKQHSLLDNPIFRTFDHQQLLAKISSNTAIAEDRDGIITFSQSVNATGFKKGDVDAVLKTDVLEYNHTNNSISTDEDVEFTDFLGNIISATGLFSDLTLRTINLKTNVKGTFNAK